MVVDGWKAKGAHQERRAQCLNAEKRYGVEPALRVWAPAPWAVAFVAGGSGQNPETTEGSAGESLGKRLFRGEFKTQDERNTIFRRMTDLALQESVRVWLVTATNP